MRQYLHWKTYLVIFALSIVGLALYYFNQVAKDVAVEEQNRVIMLVEAIKTVAIAAPTSQSDVTYATKMIDENKTIPLFITDEHFKIIDTRNLDSTRLRDDPQYLERKFNQFKSLHPPIPYDYSTPGMNGKGYLVYGDSNLLNRLRYYPLLILAITFLFGLIVVIAISNAQRSLQNQVWVGMSKETAHQIGTPLTSIVAWMELLKETESNKEWIAEMEKDVSRLQLIADRFSKIGSIPQLKEENLATRLQAMVEYMRMRKPKKVTIDFEHNEDDVQVLLSGPLFDWVIENLMRNALDAMEGEGRIFIKLVNQPRVVTIDVCDTGKGIPKNNFKKVFAPGFSTKQRGWGLGLSLAKRIIEKYHNGNIFVKSSESGTGTTFRIIFRR
ncbi:HAMP domain-containing histidine kinase [Taibaiella lutea]|uniref:histidine kinase n=1 Tax=Taibaiella lutea TaxID=2608001 RepID=A0A5M6CNC9_9BACT|nr:HAMP domain-containing sensor histidine kinase [Taibaiella lutea]KAA5536553.1 HAMP domain-containing histidine kinase [Taibaiella lutea]